MRTDIVAAAAVAVATLGFVGAVSAAEPVYVAPAPSVIVEEPVGWEGFYIGAHVGYGWANSEPCIGGIVPPATPCAPPLLPPVGFTVDIDQNGFLGGAQLGYNAVLGDDSTGVVLGAEVSGSVAGISGDTFIPPAFPAVGEANFNWLASGTAKVGFGGEHALIYAEGGVAFAGRDFGGVTGGGTCEADATLTGFTAGGGVEVKVGGSDRASIFGEYAFYGFRDDIHNCGPLGPALGLEEDSNIHTAKIGFNYLLGD